MRLLVYGGTSYAERRRIGRWPDIPPGVLGDWYGLEADVWSYGVGVLEKRPFLILRQRQYPERRGGYPFCLLLDPDDGIWERFGWNGAALADALVTAPREAVAALFDTPETSAEEGVVSLLQRLAPAAYPNLSDPSLKKFGTLLVETAAGAAVEATMADLGFATRPLPSWTAAALNDLPVPFRTGNGWLIAGGQALAGYFGAALVLDEKPGQNAPSTAAGELYLRAWNKHPDLVRPYDKPLFQWSDDADSVLSSLALLHDLEQARSLDDAALEHLEQRDARPTEIEFVLQKRALELLIGSRNRLSVKATRYLLGRSFAESLPLNLAVTSRMPEATLLEQLRARGIPPKQAPSFLDLPDKVQQAIAPPPLLPAPAAPTQEPEPLPQPVIVEDGRASGLSPQQLDDLRNRLKALLAEPHIAGGSVDHEVDAIHRAYFKYLDEIPPQLDPLIQEWLVPEVFARKFVESNLTLASLLEFFSKPARQKLIDAIAATETRQFEARAAKSITEALNKSTSRNVYTDALAQYLIDHPSLRRRLAGRRGDMPEVFARRLQGMLAKGHRQ
jgi:hypothetical protein